MPRGNVDNLRPVQTNEEARERGRAGGIASGIARRERRSFREELVALLSKGNTQEKISLAVLDKALNGDIKAFEVLRDTIGEKPVEKSQSEVNVSYENLIREIEDENEY